MQKSPLPFAVCQNFHCIKTYELLKTHIIHLCTLTALRYTENICQIKIFNIFYQIDLGPTVYSLGDKSHGLPPIKRTPRSLLRCYNITYIHSMRCLQVFGRHPKLTKFYGTYYHSLTTHLPEMKRLIAPSSLFTESEERIFSAIRGIVRSTSNRSKESIRDVGIVRQLCHTHF